MAELARALALNVATPVGLELNLEVESVQLPAVTGEIGILPNHVPILAALKPGVLRYRTAGGQSAVAAIGAGFVEADATHVRVITEFFAKPEDVVVDEARNDLEIANQKLKASAAVLGQPEQVEAQKDLDWAMARIEVAGGSVH